MTTWIFEPGHTELAFRARHMMVTSVRGAFKDVHGKLEFDWDSCLESTFVGWTDATKLWTGESFRTSICEAPTSSTSRTTRGLSSRAGSPIASATSISRQRPR